MVKAVVDCSVTGKWLIRDESDPIGDALMRQAERSGIYVPRHWYAEVGNMLAQATRRRRMTPGNAIDAFGFVARFGITVDERDPIPVMSATFDLAERHSLTYYDAAYLELALHYSAPVATFDKALVAAARAIGHPLSLDLIAE
jgi:predicted nucleic acid-binding protein